MKQITGDERIEEREDSRDMKKGPTLEFSTVFSVWM